MLNSDFWSQRFRFRGLRRRHLLVVVVILAICLLAVLFNPLIGPLFQTVYLHDLELRNDVCVKNRFNGLGNLDVTGPILLGRFKERSSSGEEALYLEGVSKLVAAHSASATGPRYVLHTAYWAGSFASDGLAFAALCQRSGTEVCRIREFRLRNTVQPWNAARIAFENTIKGRTGLRECHRAPL